jgi:hypothetical protein
VLPSVVPFLSLAQTKSLTYTLLSHMPKLHDVAKPLDENPVLLDELVIDLREMLPTEEEVNHRDYRGDVDAHLGGGASVGVERLLASTNPTRCHFLGRPTFDYRIPFIIGFPKGLDWSRTQTVMFTHAGCAEDSDFVPAFSVDTPLFDVAFDLAGDSEDDVHELAYELDDTLAVCLTRSWRADQQDAKPSLGDVQIWLHAEWEVELAKEILIENADDKWKDNYSSLKIGVKQ